jgi:hypothetical protein
VKSQSYPRYPRRSHTESTESTEGRAEDVDANFLLSIWPSPSWCEGVETMSIYSTNLAGFSVDTSTLTIVVVVDVLIDQFTLFLVHLLRVGRR